MLFVLLCGVQDIYNIKSHRPELVPCFNLKLRGWPHCQAVALRSVVTELCIGTCAALFGDGIGVFILISNDATAGSFAFLSSTTVRLKEPQKDFPHRTMKFSNSARGARSDPTSWMTLVLLCLALLMTTGCIAAEPLPVPEDNPKFQVYNFSTDAEFNLSTKLGFIAPKCSRFCYPWPADNFIDHKMPVWRKSGYRVNDH